MKKVFANWKNPDEYPPGDESTPPERWKWEFIRRNPAYQKLYNDFIKTTRKNEVRAIEQRLSFIFGIRAKHVVMIDPAIIPHHLDLYLKPSPYVDPPYIIGAGGAGQIKLELYEKETHVVLLFDISSSISDQLKRAAPLLKEHRDREKRKAKKNGRSDLFKGKKHLYPEKLQDYLRLLDAEAEGANRKDMGQFIFPDIKSPGQRVQDGIDQGIYYRDKGFLEIF